MASPALATIPEDLLVEIFLRLPTPAALARAAAACTSFRRTIKGRAFRRRFRSLHQPPLLGFMDAGGFHPAEAPHPSAPLAAALAPCTEDFSFVPPVVSSASYLSSASPSASYFPVGFLPDDEELPRWRPRDARDGRVLLDWVSLNPRFVQMWGDPEDGSDVSVLMDANELADHDPGARATWTKRERCNAADFHLALCDPLSRRYELVPTIPEDFAARPEERLTEFVPMLAPTTEDEPIKLREQSIGHRRLSAVVVGREGAIEMFSLVGQKGSFTLHHTSLQNGSEEWKLEKIIPLPDQYEDYSISTAGAAEGFLFFRGAPEGLNNKNVDYYSLEVKTYEITKVCSKRELFCNPKHALPYFSFPTLLSEPSD